MQSLFTFSRRKYVIRETAADSGARPENQQKKIGKYGTGKNEAPGSAGKTSDPHKKRDAAAAVGLEAPPESKKMPRMLSHNSNADATFPSLFPISAMVYIAGES